MTAIFKRRFLDYFNSPFGWIICSVLLLAETFGVTVLNFVHLSADFFLFFSFILGIAVFVLPVVSAFTFTKERQDGTFFWLLSLPLKPYEITVGNYFASLALFFIPTAPLLLFPPIFACFGTLNFGGFYLGLLGYFLTGAALLALSSLIACCVRRLWVAVLLGILICGGINLMLFFTELLATFPTFALIFYILVFVGIAVYLGVCKKQIPASVLTAILPTAVFTALYFAWRPFFTEFLPRILDFLNPFYRCTEFFGTYFHLPSFIYLISFSALFVILTAILPQKPLKGGNKQ